jgi:CubicO group peptidase (beta-lactamase class C family)
MIRIRTGVVALSCVLATLLAFVACERSASADRIVMPLTPGPAQPKVSAAEGGIEQAGIDLAQRFADERQARALVIARGGHVVYENYGDGFGYEAELRFDGLTPALTGLLLGKALNDRVILDVDMPLSRFLPGVAGGDSRTLRSLLASQDAETLALVLEKVSERPLHDLVTEWLWRPLGGGSLSFERKDAAPRSGLAAASCCVRARVGDWLRIAQLLARDGVFEAQQYAPPGFVKGMLRPVGPDSAQGYFTRVDGRFAARDVAWFGDADVRLWLVPSLDLTILLVGNDLAGTAGWDEAMIPDSIIRGTSGWRPAASGEGTDPRKFAPH